MTVLILNAAAIVAGSLLGNLLRKHLREDILGGVMTAIGVVIVWLGATGISAEVSALTLLFAYAVGSFIGYALDLEGKLNTLSAGLEQRFSGGEHAIIGPGINFFIVSCSGAYTINACFFAGMGDYSLLYTKIGLDLVVSLAMSSTLGLGVMFAIVPMTIFQGSLILLSGVLSPLMSEAMIAAFASAGSLIAVLIGANMVGVTKIKIVNFLPAVVLAPFAALLVERLPL